MLAKEAKVASRVILERLRREGYPGGKTILKDHLARVRPQFLAAQAFQRTSYLPGDLSHGVWGTNTPDSHLRACRENPG